MFGKLFHGKTQTVTLAEVTVSVRGAHALAERMATLQPSAIIRMAQKVRDAQAAGRDVVSLSIGVPGFLPPAHVHAAAAQAVTADDGGYLPGRGSAALVQAFSRNMADKRLGGDMTFTAQEICAQPGGKGALFNLLLALVNRGDGVVIPAPYWASYPEMVRLAGGLPVTPYAGPEQHYKLTPEQLAEALAGARVFIFNNPSNPTGMLYNRDELTALAEVLAAWDGWIIADDIYDRLVFDGSERAVHLLDVAPGLRERMVIVQSVSKTYGMPSWRVGMVAGPKQVVDALVDLASQSFTNLPGVSMAAAAAAFDGSHDFLAGQRARLATQRDLTLAALDAMHLPCPRPEGAFYVFPQIRSLLGKTTAAGTMLRDDEVLCECLLTEQGVAAVPGGAFGDGGAIRLSYAGERGALEDGLRRLQAFVAGLR